MESQTVDDSDQMVNEIRLESLLGSVNVQRFFSHHICFLAR